MENLLISIVYVHILMYIPFVDVLYGLKKIMLGTGLFSVVEKFHLLDYIWSFTLKKNRTLRKCKA